jgi:hypothetical protein
MLAFSSKHSHAAGVSTFNLHPTFARHAVTESDVQWGLYLASSSQLLIQRAGAGAAPYLFNTFVNYTPVRCLQRMPQRRRLRYNDNSCESSGAEEEYKDLGYI